MLDVCNQNTVAALSLPLEMVKGLFQWADENEGMNKNLMLKRRGSGIGSCGISSVMFVSHVHDCQQT